MNKGNRLKMRIGIFLFMIATFLAGGGFVYKAAGLTPVITTVTPASNSSMNGAGIGYYVDGVANLSSFVVTFTETGGSLDPNSPQSCVFQGTALNPGSHHTSLLTDTNICVDWSHSLVNGAVYDINFVATDASDTTTITSTNVTYDTTPPSFTVVDGVSSIPVKTDIINVTITGATSGFYGYTDATCSSADDAALITGFNSGEGFAIAGNHTDYLCIKSTDTAGNSAYQVVGQLNTDNTAPSITGVAITNGNYNIGDAITATITADAAGYTAGAITINGKGITGFASAGGSTYTVTYTVQSLDTNRANAASIPISVVLIDTAGNSSAAYTTAPTGTVTIDANAPIITSITSNATSTGWLKIGDTIAFTLTPTTTENGANVSGSYNGVALSWSTADAGVTYTATYTVAEGHTDRTPTPWQITGVTITDAAGNTSASASGSDILKRIDAHKPVITVSTLNTDPAQSKSITASTTGGTLNTPNGMFVNAGGVSTCNGTLFFDDYAPITFDLESDNTRTVCYRAKDSADNIAYTVSSAIGGIDRTAPTISSITLSDSTLKVGDTATVTFTFSEAPTGFAIDDVVLTGANGTLPSVTVDGGDAKIYTGTFTPTDNLEDTTNVISVGTGWTDAALNAPIGSSNSANYTIDTKEPTVAITLSDSTLKVGDTATVTFTFSEAPTGFAIDDVVLTGANGTLPSVTVDGGDAKIYTGTFTPTDNLEDTTNVISVGTGWTDAALNAPIGSSNSANYTIDTKEPTVAITLSDSTLKVGDTATVTFTFSEAPTGFAIDDVVLTGANGTLPSVTVDGGDAKIYTGTFTPTDNLEDTTNVISVGTGWTDAALNAPIGSSNSANYTILLDTKEPTVAITLSDSTLKVGDTATVTFTFSEAPTGFAIDDVVLTGANGTLPSVTVDGGDAKIYTGTFTPTDNLEDTTNVISVGTGWTDAALNAPIGSSNSANYTIDTKEPTVAITLSDSTLKVGDTATVTFTFSEAPTGFAIDDVVF